MTDRPPVRRCAIYTRKSSDEGLEQSFNSLDAQRDACAAYIASQRLEGWVLVEKQYDDGGLSGGSLKRPAIQTLLADMAKGEIDIVVVYKVDRLTRSLADFAKLTELFDKNQASFVAVTQQFNTSTSMGRLTLNVLLSFAQFEREVAGERIRDKIAASKRRGMWMGGHPPLGYDVKDRKLVVNEQEAERVRHICTRYLELQSVRALKKDLDASGIRSKRHIWKDGTAHGGVPISRGALYLILKSPLYRGLISHKGQIHQGEHEPIIDEDLFAAVQATLDSQGPGETARKKRASLALLKGLLFDGKGHGLQPTHSNKHGRKYSYYVSAPMLRDVKSYPDGLRVPAADLEKLILGTLAARLRDETWLTALVSQVDEASRINQVIDAASVLASEVERQPIMKTEILNKLIRRIGVSTKTIKLQIDMVAVLKQLLPNRTDGTPPEIMEPVLEIAIAGQFIRCGKQVRLVIGNDDIDQAKPDDRLIREVVRAQRWFDDLLNGRASSITELAKRDKCSAPYISRKINLAFLAPDILQSIIAGTQPRSLTQERLKKVCPLPISWQEQHAVLLA